MKKKLIGTKIFSKAEQQNFNLISSDYNPAHIFNLQKNQFGSYKPVVHGINILLVGLELYLKKNKLQMAMINCSFFKPIYLDNMVKFYNYKKKNNENYIEIKSDGLICAQINISKNEKLQNINQSEKFNYKNLKIKKMLPKINPLNLLNKTYKISFNKKKNLHDYPMVKKNLGKMFYRSMLAVSFFIGMFCPGKYAIFANLKFGINKNSKKNYLFFHIKNYNSKIRLFKIVVNGFMNIDINSFYKKIR